MKKLIIIIVFFLTMSTTLFGQQDALFSQYMFNKLVLNPAYTGSREVLTGVLLGRWQWAGIEGAPRTGSFSLHSPLRNRNMGLGMYVYHDRIGPLKDWGFMGSYSYKVRLGEGKLSFGIQAGLKSYDIDWSKLNPFDPQSGIISVQGSIEHKLIPDANFGIYYYTSRYYLGFSSKHLLENKHSVSELMINNGTFEQVSTRLFRHFYGMAGLAAPLGDGVVFRPSFLVKYVKHAPVQIDLNASFLLGHTFLLGASYRTDRAIVFMTELMFNTFRLGYSYDIWLNELKVHNTGSHEIMLGFDIGSNTRMLTPRYF